MSKSHFFSEYFHFFFNLLLSPLTKGDALTTGANLWVTPSLASSYLSCLGCDKCSFIVGSMPNFTEFTECLINLGI